MIGGLDPDHFGGRVRGGYGGGNFVARAELVASSADEELGHRAMGEEGVAVVASFGMDGKAEGDGAFDADVATGNAQADVGAEGESGEEDGEVQMLVEPVEGGADVVLLAAAVVMSAFAEPGAAEVEAEDGKAAELEGFHGVINDLVVHGSSAEGVRVTEEDRVPGVGRAGVEEGLEASGRPSEIVDGADGGGVRHRRLS